MKVFKCEEMMCDHCVSRIDGALTKAGLEHQVNLADKTVTIGGCENCARQAAEILDDLGFTPQEING